MESRYQGLLKEAQKRPKNGSLLKAMPDKPHSRLIKQRDEIVDREDKVDQAKLKPDKEVKPADNQLLIREDEN